MPMIAIVTQILSGKLETSFLKIRFLIYLFFDEEIHVWFCKSRQVPMIGELVCPRNKTTSIILLTYPSIKLPCKSVTC